MFTGIVTAVGRIGSVSRNGGRGTGEGGRGLTLTIRAPYKGVKQGESIAVNGACLTVERVVRGGFTVHVIETTAGRTLFGEYAPGRLEVGDRVHVEADALGKYVRQLCRSER